MPANDLVAAGDIIFYLWHGKPEWARVTGRSTLNPNVVFARNDQEKPRVIHQSAITRIIDKAEQ